MLWLLILTTVPESSVLHELDTIVAAYADHSEALEEPDKTANDDEEWWKLFGDPALTQAIEEGLGENRELRAAATRVQQARSTSLVTLAPYLPQVSADGTAQAAPFDSLGFQFGGGIAPQPGVDPPDVFYTGSALLNARWELDIWARGYLDFQAARLERLATEGDQASAAHLLSTAIGDTYFDVVVANELIDVVEEQIEANQSLLRLLEFRFERGDTTALDVLQQEQQLAARSAELPPLRVQLRLAQQRLLVLLGRSPTGPSIDTAPRLAKLPPQPSLGLPKDLLSNRPDLRAALDRMDSAKRRSGHALERFLPSLSINGSTGWQFFRAEETSTVFLWGAGATLSIPLFDGLNNVAQLQRSRAQELQAEENLAQAFLQAVQEVEAARTSEEGNLKQLHLLRKQEAAAGLALQESEIRYISGLGDYLAVLTALNAQHAAQRAALQAHRDSIDARIRLHEALAGPWTLGLGAARD
ncbi:MAG: TolC family protein [Myxococcota bacterium]